MPVTPAELCSVGVETRCAFSVDVAVISKLHAYVKYGF